MSIWSKEVILIWLLKIEYDGVTHNRSMRNTNTDSLRYLIISKTGGIVITITDIMSYDQPPHLKDEEVN